jgi:hypothetical protein
MIQSYTGSMGGRYSTLTDIDLPPTILRILLLCMLPMLLMLLMLVRSWCGSRRLRVSGRCVRSSSGAGFPARREGGMQ